MTPPPTHIRLSSCSTDATNLCTLSHTDLAEASAWFVLGAELVVAYRTDGAARPARLVALVCASIAHRASCIDLKLGSSPVAFVLMRCLLRVRVSPG